MSEHTKVGGVEPVIRNDGPESSYSVSKPAKQSSYVPQFSTTTSLIIDRMNRIPHNPSTKVEDDSSLDTESQRTNMHRTESEPGQRLKETLVLPLQPTSATSSKTSSPGLDGTDLIATGVKRKRESSTEKVDFTQNTIAFPWVDQPVEVLPTPSHEEVSRSCFKCEAQFQSLEAPFVTCTRCSNSWHRQCHSPPVLDMSVSLSFVCVTCTAEQDVVAKLRGRVSIQRRDEIERLRRKRLATLPQYVVPAKPELVGFGPGHASNSSRVEYFSNKKKVDLLNILSLCDQIKPQLLADILVSVSKKHPDLPIFDSPDWELQLPSAQRSAKASTAEKPRHGHTVVSLKAKLKARATKKILKRTRVIEVVTDAPGEDEDVLPSTWAKANEGLYSNLIPDTEDNSFLADDNDEESFSHFMVDSFGKQIVEAVGG